MYYLLILAIVVWYAFEHTPIGRYMFATGGNPDAARLAGVRTDRLVWASLVASTVIAGFAGLIYSWKVGTYSESIGPGYLFPAIAAVFFGASQLPGPLAPGCRVARQPSPRHEGSQARPPPPPPALAADPSAP